MSNMKRHLIILFALLPLCTLAKVEVTNLRVENLKEPLGIDTNEPRFSWQITSDKKDVRQTAYQLIVSNDQGEVWNTGKVTSDEQLWIRYQGEPLKSATFCTWKLKVFTNKGETEWTHGGRFSTGLLNESKWGGYWIGLESLQPDEERGFHTRLAARYLRKEFKLKAKTVRRATAYVAGIGLHEFYVNGQRQGNRVLSPVPSDYRKTIYYNTYDITEQLKLLVKKNITVSPILIKGNKEKHPNLINDASKEDYSTIIRDKFMIELNKKMKASVQDFKSNGDKT